MLHLGSGKKLRWYSPISSEFSERASNVHQVHHEGNRAKLVLGDVNVAGIDEVVKEIKKAGGCVYRLNGPKHFCALDTNVCNSEAVGQKCDVTNWDSQLALFELGISSFGAIDVVVCPHYFGNYQ